MTQLSPHYRNDDDSRLDPDTEAYLDEQYFNRLGNLDKANPKLVVVFSGGNAVGKSTLARKVEDRFHALVLENDAVKRCLLRRNPDLEKDERNRITWQYTINLYPRLSELTPNGLVVRDGVIDWYFERILPVFERLGYQLFVIGFDIPRARAKQLIKQRGDTPTVKEERFYKLLQDHAIHTKRFRERYRPDVTLTDDNLYDHELVLQKLGERLEGLL